MTRPGDYSDEMGPLAISDSDVERILRGRAPDGPGLSRLVSIVDELRTQGNPHLRPEVIAAHVTMAAEATREALAAAAHRDAATVLPTPEAMTPKWRIIPRLGTSLATLALLVGTTGVAVASDAAIPGDPLHGFDLAFENIGIGAGGAEERISEARELALGGMPVEALDYVSSAIGNEQGEASNALKEAAERLRALNSGPEQAIDARERVAEMLDWMAATDVEGRDFGQRVAERARELGHEDSPDVEPASGSNGGNGLGNQGSGKGR